LQDMPQDTRVLKKGADRIYIVCTFIN